MSDNEQIDLSDETIEHSSNIASLIMEGIFKREEDNYDPGAAIFSLFINCIHHLNWMGWSTQELVNEIFNHAECDIEDEETKE